jgi:glutathione S-transferase
MTAALPELFQTEWCPASRRVRERMTELGVDYVTRQVPVERERRARLERATGAATIPALIVDLGPAVIGEDEILAYLDVQYALPDEAEAHRVKAAKARRRYLEEECECSQPATR